MRSFQIIVLVTVLHIIIGQSALAIHEANSAADGSSTGFWNNALEIIIKVLYFPAGPIMSMMPDDVLRGGTGYLILFLNALLWAVVINLITKPFRRNTKWTNTL